MTQVPYYVNMSTGGLHIWKNHNSAMYIAGVMVNTNYFIKKMCNNISYISLSYALLET